MAEAETLHELRIKKLGILIYDARLSSQKTIEECSTAMGVSEEKYTTYESGLNSPSLPEIESLAFYLNVPLEHFWGKSLISDQGHAYHPSAIEQLHNIRNKMIGTQLRIAREDANLSLDQISEIINLSPDIIDKYETGDISIPLPVLESLVKMLDIKISDLFDKNGPVGIWHTKLTKVDSFSMLSPDIQQFICKQENLPYIKLAIKISSLPSETWSKIKEIIINIPS